MINGYPPAIIRKRDRLSYISSLEKAQLAGGEGNSKDDYFKLISKAIDRSLDIYLKAIKGEDQEQPQNEDKLLKIGQLAKQASEANSTIRHWTKLGLLEVAEITDSGYQLYSHDMIDRVKKIKKLKEKRLTLEEIKKAIS
jgi:hypothetical protein